MLRLVPDHLKTRNMCKTAIKKLPFFIKYVPDRCKTQRMCRRKVITENGGMLMFIPNCYKDQNTSNKKLVIKLSIITQFFPDRFKTQEMCDKAVDTCPFVFHSVPD